jgi:hypothetical protein
VDGLFVFILALVCSWAGYRFLYVYDDAGITLRYASRFATGRGLNYNDGEFVNGMSTPLFVFAEAILLRLGLAPYEAILCLGSLCFAATASVLFTTFARFYSLAAALLAVFVLLAFDQPFEQITSGMEVPFVVLLAALLFRALHFSGALFRGIVLGLLVANKLDGALAAIAFTGVYLAHARRFPWRTALVAVLVALPVMAVLLVQFGSILPNSMMVKLTVHSATLDMDPLWMHKVLSEGGSRILYWGAVVSLLWLPLARDLARSFPHRGDPAWFVLHMGAYAVTNLGGMYPWYASAPEIQSVILASFLVHELVQARMRGGKLVELPSTTSRASFRAAWIPGLLIGSLAIARLPEILGRFRSKSFPPGVTSECCRDLARQATGAWLRKHTSCSERLSTFEGLPAFEYGGPCFDFSLLNSAPNDARISGSAYRVFGPVRLDTESAPGPRQS